jgi:hypothetical protein
MQILRTTTSWYKVPTLVLTNGWYLVVVSSSDSTHAFYSVPTVDSRNDMEVEFIPTSRATHVSAPFIKRGQ